MNQLHLQQFCTLTFDCYGTLIDWQAGILSGLRPLLERHAVTLTDDQILERYGRYETQLEAGPYRPYRDVLRGVVEQFGREFGFDAGADRDILIDTFVNWRPFPDTIAALQSLHRHYRLVLLSNVDDALFAITASHLQIPFDAVLTAEQIGSYKPSLRNFEYARQQLGLTNADHLHVAQSLYHDIAPARSLGIATVWVNRQNGVIGVGAAAPDAPQPDLEVPDMRRLAELTEQAFAASDSQLRR